jgi:hypothetical protein
LSAFISLLDGCSFVRGGSLLRLWTVRRRASLLLGARSERRDPQGTGSPLQSHLPPEGAHGLRPTSLRVPGTPFGAAARHGSYRCARKGRSDQLTVASLLQQPLDPHVHPPDAVSLVPVQLRPHYAAVRKLNQGYALKLAPTASSVQPAKQAQETNLPPYGDDLDATDGATKPEAGHAATLTRGWSYWCPSTPRSAAKCHRLRRRQLHLVVIRHMVLGETKLLHEVATIPEQPFVIHASIDPVTNRCHPDCEALPRGRNFRSVRKGHGPRECASHDARN